MRPKCRCNLTFEAGISAVDIQAGEREVGCDCTHLSVTADGNADRTRVFTLLRPCFTGWVAEQP